MNRIQVKFRRLSAIARGVLMLTAGLVVLPPCLSAGAFGQVPGGGSADAGSAAAGKTLVVATRQVPPFAMKTDGGEWRGIAIELWQQAADELGLTCEFREAEIDDMVNGLDDGRFDAAVAALTMTAEREARVDFTHPFFASGLGIAVPRRPGTSLFALLSSLASWQFFSAVATLAVVLLAVGVVVWACERRANADEFGGHAIRGIGSGFWWSAVTMTTVGYGDKSPRSVGGRMVALVWMFASIIIISGMTAAIASALTVSRLSTGIAGPEDLYGVSVGSVDGSTAEDYLDDKLINVKLSAATPREALAALAGGKVQAVVYDAPILRYLVNRELQPGLMVLPREFSPQNYAIALPQDSELREPLNQIILRRINEPSWRELVARYLGDGRSA